MIDIDTLLNKVANGGTTAYGILAVGEWNTLVQAVKELQGLSASAETVAALQSSLNKLNTRLTAVEGVAEKNTSSASSALLAATNANNDLATHKNDTTVHVTSAEKSKWNTAANKVIPESLISGLQEVSATSDAVSLLFTEADTVGGDDDVVTVEIPAATTTKAGVMTAADKRRLNAGATMRFDGFADDEDVLQDTAPTVDGVYYDKTKASFFAKSGEDYYGDCEGCEEYMAVRYDETGDYDIRKDKLYLYNDKVWLWSDSEDDLVGVDAAALSEIEELRTFINPRTFINANILLGYSGSMTFDGMTAKLEAMQYLSKYVGAGTVVTFLSTDGWASYQFLSDDSDNGIQDTNNWRKFGGSATVGNCYNVTNDVPLTMGYYTLETAIAEAYTKGYTTVGIQITFAVGESTWKTYQYIGADSTETNFKNPDNWLDLAGMASGAETLINVDYLCGACTSAAFYTLEYAIAAIKALQNSTGITYAKSGLVITYKTADNTWECKQFKGEATDFGEAALWQDFGGGGSTDVETSDIPEEGGTDAFSTGGAYSNLPTDLKVDTETEGVVKISMVNVCFSGDIAANSPPL